MKPNFQIIKMGKYPKDFIFTQIPGALLDMILKNTSTCLYRLYFKPTILPPLSK